MEDRLAKALEFANYRQTLNNQIQELRVKTETQLIISKNGGTFTINESFISFLDFLVKRDQEEAVLLDNNKTPILIKGLDGFLDEILTRYLDVTYNYLDQYEKVRKSRSVTKILDLE